MSETVLKRMPGGSQPGTQLSPVPEAAISGLSEILRDIFSGDWELVLTRFSGLRGRARLRTHSQ
jgi:hypothetical protein